MFACYEIKINDLTEKQSGELWRHDHEEMAASPPSIPDTEAGNSVVVSWLYLAGLN